MDYTIAEFSNFININHSGGDFKMEENYLEASRNGHELRDMYNLETNTLDMRSNGLYPSNVLSNLCSNAFVFDGVECGSMEGFLQSLKCKDEERQRQICEDIKFMRDSWGTMLPSRPIPLRAGACQTRFL